MMKAIDLLERLQARDVKLAVSGGKLQYNAPTGVVTPELLEQVASHKTEIIALLQPGERGIRPMAGNLILGDCFEIIKTMPEGSIDLMVTDPPYGLSFMGKDWDKALPAVEVWRECLRVLKPGAFAFIMCSPRQDLISRMVVNLQEAGFETRFTSLFWAYATGFPKASNVGRVSRRKGTKASKAKLEENRCDEAFAGFQPKPALEVILVVMKPLEKKSYVEQARANGKGITWLDDCRVPYSNPAEIPVASNIPLKAFDKIDINGKHYKQGKNGYKYYHYQGDLVKAKKGRFPANLLVSDSVLDDGRPHAGGTFPERRGETAHFGLNLRGSNIVGRIDDTGGFSRFFSIDAWAERNLPFLIVPKPTRAEKDAGCENLKKEAMLGNSGLYKICRLCGKRVIGLEGQRCECQEPQHERARLLNHHPTVKPIRLMAYLITMGSRKGDLVLDPFCGSGATCIAAHQLERRWIGIELNPDYCEIAAARMRAVARETFMKSKAS